MKKKEAAKNAFAMLDALGGASSKREAKALKLNTAQEAQETREKADAAWKMMCEKHEQILKLVVRLILPR